jgi:hypothetical protein
MPLSFGKKRKSNVLALNMHQIQDRSQEPFRRNGDGDITLDGGEADASVELQKNDTVPPASFSHSSVNVPSKHNQDASAPFPVELMSVAAFSSALSIKADQMLESALSLDDHTVNSWLSNDLEPIPIDPSLKMIVVKQLDFAQCGCFRSSSLSDSFLSDLSKIFCVPMHRPYENTRDTPDPNGVSFPPPLQTPELLIQASPKLSISSSAFSTKALSSEGRSPSDRWNESYQHLKEFVQKQGHCQVPINYKRNPLLSRWVRRQRYERKLKQEGKPSAMTAIRYALLEDLGFLWDVRNSTWDSRFREMLQFHALHGHCCVSIKCKEFPKLVSLDARTCPNTLSTYLNFPLIRCRVVG